VQEVHEAREFFCDGVVVDGVVAGVRTERFEHGAVVVADRGDVDLHGPAFVCVLLAEEVQHEGFPRLAGARVGFLARQSPRESFLGFLFPPRVVDLVRAGAVRVVGCGGERHEVQAVVGGDAAHFMEEVDARFRRGEEVVEAGDGDACGFPELRDVIGEVGLLDV